MVSSLYVQAADSSGVAIPCQTTSAEFIAELTTQIAASSNTGMWIRMIQSLNTGYSHFW